jgi:hypothetical protein
LGTGEELVVEVSESSPQVMANLNPERETNGPAKAESVPAIMQINRRLSSERRRKWACI